MSAVILAGVARPANGARATAEKPMRRCVVQDAAAIAALRSGDKRLSIVVKSFRPPAPRSAAIVVRLAGAQGGTPIEITRFGVHPPRAFDARAEPQRFLVSLASRAALLKEGEPLCVEIGFEAAEGAATGGEAEIDVEVVDLPGRP